MPVVLRERFRPISVALVKVDGEIIQEALDYLENSSATSVLLMIGPNGDCVGIDTSQPLPPMSRRESRTVSTDKETLPRQSKVLALSHDEITLKSLTEATVMEAMREINAAIKGTALCNHLKIPKSASNIRGKVFRLMSKLALDGKLQREGGGQGVEYTYSIPNQSELKKATKAVSKENGATKGFNASPPTEQQILAILKPDEDFMTMDIGDQLKYDRKDTKNRIKITSIFNSLMERGMLKQTGTARGIMKVYRLA